MDDFMDDDVEFGGMMDPVNLKKRKLRENETEDEDQSVNQSVVENEPEKDLKKTRPIGNEEGDEDEEEEGKEEENKEESFDISSSDEEEQEDEENFDLFETLEGPKVEQTIEETKKTEEKQQPEEVTKPGTSKQAEIQEKKKRISIDTSGQEQARKKKIEQIEEENKKMQVLMANFSEEQLNRYETFRRSAFQKSSIKKIIQTVCGKSVSQSVVIAMSGISKVFVGEIVEKALDVKEKWGDTGALQPKHLREAFRLFKSANKLSDSVKFKKPSLF
ncbi:unnamed protein product [Brachionus calyciflorus]|uniref:TAFII28-like protein domain-containing protein n=1 Tax=Brachionus calyciflorus TaxID=104777 RepID=A0A813UGM5_9BILA|nr:unnamed protein product [Brachionus calyciflorus]